MNPQWAKVTIHYYRRVPTTVGADGNTWNFREEHTTKEVSAKVWPVAMSANELLVEYEDGRMGKAKLCDICMEVSE